MTILDPAAVANLAVFLVQLPRGRASTRSHSTAPPPVEFASLESARVVGEVVISETGATERVRLENHGTRDLFLQAGEVLRGGDQDRAVAGDLIIPAPKHEPESHLVPVFCAEPERSAPLSNRTPDQFTSFDQTCPGRRLKKELRLGTQEDVWREISALRDVVFDLVSHGGTRDTPPYSLWMLIDLLESHGWLTPYLHPLLPLAEANLEATGAVFVLGGQFNSAGNKRDRNVFVEGNRHRKHSCLLYFPWSTACQRWSVGAAVWPSCTPGRVSCWRCPRA